MKDLFTVPEGQKVTEKVFGRVLISSVCGILLCMACLAGTTWAWFAVSIENAGNVIEIADIQPVVQIRSGETVLEAGENGNYLLSAGTYDLSVGLKDIGGDGSDQTGIRSTAYVIITASSGGRETYGYVTFENRSEEKTRRVTVLGAPAELRFTVSWVEPASDLLGAGEAIVIGE